MVQGAMTRAFASHQATRASVPMLVGLAGPTTSGKTYSALRLATGMQRVTGGAIYFIDTEAGRALHYAPEPGQDAKPQEGTFAFKHVPFSAPFGPLDYLAAIEFCAKEGGEGVIIIVDSMSHEHEGPGGVLEIHDAETKRLKTQWNTSWDKASRSGWIKPKQERQRCINTIKQLGCNAIFCFRAKEKLDDKMKPMGWMPIAGDEYPYEMMLRCVLYPGSDGVPNWDSQLAGEKLLMRLPRQFEHLFPKDKQAQLSEDIGEAIAKWASGGAEAPKAPPADESGGIAIEAAVEMLLAATSQDEITSISQRVAKGEWSDDEKAELSFAYKQRLAQLKESDDG